MTKAVFTTKVTPSYKDLPEDRYHFPRTYLNYVRQSVGDYIVYYEPRRSRAFSWLVTIAGIGEKVHAFCWREAGKRIGYRLVEGFESSCTGLA